VRNEDIHISGVIRRAATLVNGGILTFALRFLPSPSTGKNAQMRASKGARFTSGATERLTLAGATAPLTPSIKRGSANKATVTMLFSETVKDMFRVAMGDRFSSNVNPPFSLTTSSSRAHSRRTPGVLGSPMNCNNLCLKGVLQICIKHV